MASNEFTFVTKDGAPQDQSPSRSGVSRRSTMLSLNSESSIDDQSNNTSNGTSLNLSGLGSLNYHGSEDEHSASESFEDEKARIMACLMQNHSEAVTASLVERTMLIQSIIWLSRHVPWCVLELLFETILHSRTAEKERNAASRDQALTDGKSRNTESTGDSEIVRAMKELTTDDGDSANLESCMGDGKTDSGILPSTDDEKASTLETSTAVAGDTSVSTDKFEYLQPLNDTNAKHTHAFLPIREESLPISKNHDSALLFVDMSGFTKISTMLDVESLSNAINSYFQLIVSEVTNHGGDILKFAGDAIFAEWKVSTTKPDQSIEYCVIQAANCAASIVANCSDYPIHSKPVGLSRASMRLENTRQSSQRGGLRTSLRSSVHSSGQSSNRNLRGSIQSADECYNARRTSMVSDDSTDDVEQLHRRGSTGETQPYYRRSSVGHAVRPVKLATLNVKCGIGLGRIVGVHVGDDSSRREYLILGDPIDQVAAAESLATSGEVLISPEAMQVLSKVATLRQSCDEAIRQHKPVCIAEKQQRFFEVHEQLLYQKGYDRSNDPESILHRCERLGDSELRWLMSSISLYTHPVVVNDERESHTQVSLRRDSDFDRHLSQAELRNVFVMFISPMIDYKLTGNEEEDAKLIILLNDIMNLTTKHLRQAGGHLRQFIVDDKGVVLICTFGLRGSTFPNMISQRALPFTRSIYESFEELGVKSRIGATFGRAYCGVVGAQSRHEFAVLGPSVNLAARLMSSKLNPGILVDKNIRLLTTSSQIFFKPLPPVNAKGYDEPVPIFEPLKSNDAQFGGKLRPNFVGRTHEIKQVMHIAKGMVLDRNASIFVFVSATSGSGKSSMLAQTTARIRAMMKKIKKTIIVTRHVSNEGDSRVPFSLFRSIFKDLLNQMRYDDDARSHSSNRGESFEVSVDGIWDDLSLASQSTKDSVVSNDANRFQHICDELNAPPEFIEVVGKRLLGIRDKSSTSNAISGTPNLDNVVEFLADAFIRCTKHMDIALLQLDDVQDLDEMSFKVVQCIFQRASNVLIFCGSRPLSDYSLAVDSSFWEELHDSFSKQGRFVEISLQPLTECEVRYYIALSLSVSSPDEIDQSFSRNIYTATGGMPHFLSYAIDAIKRQELFTRLDNGLIGLKSTVGDEEKVSYG